MTYKQNDSYCDTVKGREGTLSSAIDSGNAKSSPLPQPAQAGPVPTSSGDGQKRKE